jgi:glyceraldehyde 3-phosphate dehydrogenase
MKALNKILPGLEGKLTGLSFRVPVVDVSVVDLTISTTIPITTPILHQIIRDHNSPIIGFSADPCVSSDFIGDAHSCIVDLAHTYVTGYHQTKIVAYYDNEMAYSHRVLDLIEFLASKSS